MKATSNRLQGIGYQLKQKTSDVNPRLNALNNTALAVKLRRNHGREPVELHEKLFLGLILFSLILNLACVAGLLQSLISPPLVLAQLETTDVYDLTDAKAEDGDILSYTDKGLVRTDHEYDNKLFGIIQLDPPVSYRRQDGTGTPVTRSGTVMVNVTTINGPIKVGDLVTSSNMAGKGEKAENSGYVIGVALQEFKEGEGTEVNYSANNGAINKKVSLGKIKLAIKIEYAELTTARNSNRLLDAVNSAFFKNVSDPEKFVNIMRYILAGLAVIISFAVGFFTFARTIPKGIEALGRNPLARTSIQLGIIINIAFTILIALAGIAAAVVLLRF